MSGCSQSDTASIRQAGCRRIIGGLYSHNYMSEKNPFRKGMTRYCFSFTRHYVNSRSNNRHSLLFQNWPSARYLISRLRVVSMLATLSDSCSLTTFYISLGAHVCSIFFLRSNFVKLNTLLFSVDMQLKKCLSIETHKKRHCFKIKQCLDFITKFA